MAKKIEVQVKSTSKPNLMEDAYYGVAEKTFEESSYIAATQFKPYNPDDLWQKTSSYAIYEDMLNDDQVHVALQLKKDLVLNSGFDIVPSEDGQEDMAKDIESSLEDDPEIPFIESLEEVLSAFEFGVSGTEKVFKRKKDGKIALKYLKTRHPDTWLFHTDAKGNIKKIEQQGVKTNVEINPKSLIHYVNNRKFQNPYGRSDLRPAYAAWFAKRQIVRYYAIFSEKAASPTPVARYDKNAPKNAVDAIHNAIKKLQVKTALTIPKEIEIEFLETKGHGEVYVKGIEIFNMFIGRSMFVPDLMGFQGAETTGGAQSLGREQLKLFFKHITRRRTTLERIVNKHIVRPIVIANYGIQKSYPKFKLRPIDLDDIIESAKLWVDLVKSRVYRPTLEELNHFRGLVNFPESDELEIEEETDEGLSAPKSEGNEKKIPQEKPVKEKAPEGQTTDKGTFAKVFNDTNGDFHKKVDFAKIETQLQSAEEQVTSQAEPVINQIYEDLFDQIGKKKIIEGKKVDRIQSIKLKNLKTIKQILNASFRETWKQGKISAQRDLFKSIFAEPLPADEFLTVLDQENFDFVGDWEYNVTKSARIEMVAAIKDGRPLSSVINILNEDSKRQALISIERYARTKTTEIFNKSRLEFFEQSGVVTNYQYSAILDGRTTAICRGLHGKIFKAGTQPVPPLHFNCRSLLIPITKFEEAEPDTTVELTSEVKKTLPKKVRESFGKRKTIGIDEFTTKNLEGTGFPGK